ncbi:hypothetical protein V5R04_06725 [Jonesiaceae bacterium BS-20]|uniref:Uncharacterized protein n=1 Tax=Jonesiaceae bacterium BS-20 TaxID=3120821 RepID=A0AAU7E043_9MICO
MNAYDRREYERLRAQLGGVQKDAKSSPLRDLFRKHPVAVCSTGIAALGLLGWVTLIGPQLEATSVARDELSFTQTQNATMAAHAPALQAQLTSVAPRIAELYELSARVPNMIDQPELIRQLHTIAKDSGVTSLQSIEVGLPQPVANVVPEEQSQELPMPSVEDAEQAGQPEAPQVETAAIAQYNVTMRVNGSPDSVNKFVTNLRTGPRLSVVTRTSVDIGQDGVATSSVSATFYLQQVDVSGLASQLQDLLIASGLEKPDLPADQGSDSEEGADTEPPAAEQGNEGDAVDLPLPDGL